MSDTLAPIVRLEPRRRRRAADAIVVMAPLADVATQAVAYAKRKHSEHTLRVYASQWRVFEEWCAARQLEPMPCAPPTLRLYLTDRSNAVRPATLAQAISAIAYTHKQSGVAAGELPHLDQAVQDTLSGIRRTHGTAARRVAPLLAEDLRAVAQTLPDTLAGRRDRALLAVGFSGALRRSELVALRVSDIAFTAEGLKVRVRRSKTDQEGKGATVGLPASRFAASCPVRTLRAWLDAAGIREGRVFRSLSNGRLGKSLTDRAVASIIKDATAGAGLATSAARSGKHDRDIMTQGRWLSHEMLATYVRDARLFGSHNAADGL
jgi:site-specific recombinase XerD